MNKHRKDTMTVMEHLGGELRLRIIIFVVAFVAATIFCFTRVDYLRYLLARPGGGGLKLFFFFSSGSVYGQYAPGHDCGSGLGFSDIDL